jgi:hypothetical protein
MRNNLGKGFNSTGRINDFSVLQPEKEGKLGTSESTFKGVYFQEKKEN